MKGYRCEHELGKQEDCQIDDDITPHRGVVKIVGKAPNQDGYIYAGK